MVIAEKTTENLGFEKLIFLHYIFAAFEKKYQIEPNDLSDITTFIREIV